MSKYENQNPYRESDWESDRGTNHWYDEHGEFHRDGDLPAVSHPSGWVAYYNHGLLHREGGKPAVIYQDGCVEYWVYGEQVEQVVDMVNHPPHYGSDNGIECIEAIRAALGKEGFIAFCRGNAIKYTWREKADSMEDRKKAIWYLTKANEENLK